MRVEQTEIVIRLGRGPFDQAERANERPRKAVTADREIQNGALRGGAVEAMRGHIHLAHRIFFHARLFPHADTQRRCRRGANGLSTSWTCVRRPVPTVLCENSDEHRRNVLQKIFRFVALEKRGVLLQFVRDLVNDETCRPGASASYVFRRSARFLSILRMLNGMPERCSRTERSRGVSAHAATWPHRHGSHGPEDRRRIAVPEIAQARDRARTGANARRVAFGGRSRASAPLRPGRIPRSRAAG